jgi:D-glycero-alpha-D-manno-heptose-7-phosphate kinase
VLIRADAPSRVDLAGGTLDIWPLYLFEGGGITVNCSIDLRSWVTVETRDDNLFCVRADDMDEEQAAEDLDAMLGGALDLPARVVKHYAPPCGLNVTTRNDAPKGSGLGASSSLVIALSGAMCELTSREIPPQQLVDNAANLEAQCIGIPTGKQDYYAAMYGGVNAIWFEVEGDRVEHLDLAEEDLREIEGRFLLSFTGTSRFSGASNWAMLKNYVDRVGTAVDNVGAIKKTALRTREALVARRWDSMAKLLAEEWGNRKGLAEGVSTPQTERMMMTALGAGALANKLCGAGGGGCMITYVPPESRSDVENALAQAGAELLEFKIARTGLSVRKVSD